MKMAILGAGVIARKMATTIREMEEITSWAIGTRDVARAEEFAQEFGFAKAYGSYEELVADDEIDLIYVATPHSHHYQHAKLCLEHGKNVLVEKAFTMNHPQAKELVELAEEKGLLLAEAIWTRYLPMRETIDEVIESGIIGEVTSVAASLTYTIDHVPRIRDPKLAGGALLDLGVYVLNYASMILGDEVQDITAAAVMTEDGVDSQNSITLTYPDGKMAVLYTSTMVVGDREGQVNGRNGHLKIDNINNYERIRVYNDRYELIKTIEAPPQITGFEYEVRACKAAIEAGKTECPQMPHATILHIMGQMDEIRKGWGMTYPGE